MSSFGNFRDGLSGLSGKMSQLQRRLSQGMMQDDEVPRDQPSLGSSAASSPNPPLSNPAFSSSTLPNSTGNQPNQNSMYNSASSSIQMQQQQSSSANNNASSSLRGDRPNMSLNLNSTSPGGGGVSGSGNVQGGVGPGAAGAGGNPSMMMTGGPPGSAYQRQQQQRQQQQQQEEQARQQQGRHVSAPTSPTKTTATGSAANIARSIFRQVSQSTTNLVQQTVAGVSGGPRDKAKILLVIDDQHTDWSKYFRGRRIQNEFDVRIEQAEFNEINMAAFSDRGTMVDMEVTRGGTKVVRSFRPDFVLIRQPIRDANRDYRHILLALMYGNVPSVNSLDSLYTFLDKPLVFSQLIQIQQRLGRDKFPLIQQSFYPNHREMLTAPSFPVVCKIGHAHAGLGKVRVDSHYDFQDVASLVGSCGAYCSVEPFVDSKQDLHLQKIGPSYKAFIRKSISGSWKANIGSSMLEQIPLQEKHRFWLDECSRLFGGLDVFAIEAVVGKDGQEFIIGLNDSSSMGLLGETQEEDRQLIGEIVYRKMDSDANRRRLSAVQSSAGSAAPPSGVNQSGASGGQVPNGYASGGQPRRSSRDATTDGPSGASTRERDQSVPNYAQRNSGMTTDRPSGPPTMGPPSGGPYGRPDVTGRDPPTRDPRDSNIRDVSGMRDSSRNTSMDREAGPPPPPPLAPGSRDLQNNREVPTREGSNSRFRDGPMDPRTAGSFGGAGGVPASGSSGSSVGSQQPQPHSYAGAGLPPRQMSRGNMGGPVGSSGGDPTSGGSGSNRGSLSQQGQGLAGGPQQQQQGRMPGQVGGDTEDTMSNLKKTFAGIFGDM